MDQAYDSRRAVVAAGGDCKETRGSGTRYSMLLVAIATLGAALAQDPRGGIAHPEPSKSRQKTYHDYFVTLPPASARVRKQTPVAAWSQSGWNVFRWGMGPADVADRLRDKRGDFRLDPAGVWDECVASRKWKFSSTCFIYAGHAFTLLGSAPAMDFDFIDDRLSSIKLTFLPDAKRFFSAAEALSLFTQLRTLFEREYGAPYFEYSTPTPIERREDGVGVESRSVQWKIPHSFAAPRQPSLGFEVEIEARLVTSPALPDGRGDVNLTYSEEDHEDHFNRRVRGEAPTSEAEKLRGVSVPDDPGKSKSKLR